MEIRFSNDIWNHFTRYSAESGLEKQTMCNRCKITLRITGRSTGNLIGHLKQKHPMIHFSLKDETNRSRSPLSTVEEETDISADQQMNSYPSSSSYSRSPICRENECDLVDFETPVIQSTSGQVSTKTFVETAQQKKHRDLDCQVLKMICKEYHSFTLVDDAEFKEFVKIGIPDYKLPKRETISQSLIPSLYTVIRDKLKVKLSRATSICITCDGWTSIKNTCFYTVTAHYFDNAMKLHSNLIECSEFYENHSETNISEWLDQVLKKWNIRNKIVAAVTDNGENIRAAINLLSIRHISCYAHTLNFLMQNALECNIKDVINRVKTLVQYFNKSSTALSKLGEMQTNMKKPQLKLKDDFPTRWNSTYEMLNTVLINREPIIATLVLLESQDLLKFEAWEWEIIEHAVILLEVFDEVTNEISADKYVSLSKTSVMFRGLVHRMILYLKEKREKSLPNKIIALAKHLLQGLVQSFGERGNHELISQAIFLDPRFKRQGFMDEVKYKSTFAILVGKIQEINASLSSKPSTPEPELQAISSSVWDDFDATMEDLKSTKDPTTAALRELNKYVVEHLIHRTSDPLPWWEDRKYIYPNLYELARQHLCIPASSVPCEQIFTKEGQIRIEKRSRLTSSNMSQIVFLNSNLK